MNYQDMDLQRSYISKGDNNFADAFLNPVLSCTKEYKRSVGFFTSSALTAIEEGIIDLARNGGTIKLIASPRLSEEDAQAIRLGYEIREEYILNNFTREFVAELEALDDPALNLLIELISKNILDIKIAVTDDLGIYHDKLGILRDFDDNVIAFFGSPNASLSGYRFNYERIRIAKSWQSGSAEIVAEEDKEFDQLWNNKNEFVEVYDYQETAHQQIIQIIARRRQKKNKVDIILRDYQEQAIAAWIANGYRGFFVMATGTGKTWTAIYSAKALVNQQPVAIIICAPYIHLIKQWHEDVKAAFPDANIVLVSSENPDWDKQITNAAIKSNYNSRDQLIIISTIKSFYSNKFEKI
ncbi:MAG: DEAD/DEAH box helicase family protein [Clostridiaceae bacterium]|nr:DEAD/DEAH box helicase family protein [Clostridiaceae bacterium]